MHTSHGLVTHLPQHTEVNCTVLKNCTLLENAIYHIINVAIVNAFILYNYLVYQAGLNVISEHVWAKHF